MPSNLRSLAGPALIATLVLAGLVAMATLLPVHAPRGVPGSDKTFHVLGFAALAFPMAAARPATIPAVVLALAAYGGAIEIIQPWVGRGRELLDWIADLIGIALGVGLGYALNRLALRLRRWR